MKKYIKTLTSVCLLAIAVLSIIFAPTIFQEGNPIPVLYGIVKITTTGNTYAKIGEHKYIVRANKTDVEKLLAYFSKHNLIYKDRAGSGYLFTDKQGKIYTAIERMYSTQFEIFDFSNTKNEGLMLP